MPIVSACADDAAERAASSTTSRTDRRRGIAGVLPVGSLIGYEDGVLVRVGRRAAAQQDERLVARVDEAVHLPGRDDDTVARRDVALLVAERHVAVPGREEVQLLGDAVVVR